MYLQELADLANQRGGILLSNKYKNSYEKLEFQCALKHKFLMNRACVRRGQWCVLCKGHNRCEEICRAYFESIFKEKFPKTRPKWLVNADGNCLELDGYCAKLNIAFEHNGNQHYQEVKFLQSDLQKIVKHDKLKIKLCQENNVKLIVIPQLGSKTKLPKLIGFIKAALNKFGLNLSKLDFSEPDLSPIYTNQNKLTELREVVENKNGVLIDIKWHGSMRKYSIKCNVCAHKWAAMPHNIIKRNEWCRKCARKLKHTIEDARELAGAKGGNCLSEEYINNSSKLLWQCSCGNTWWASYNAIQSGCWCPSHSAGNRSAASIEGWKSRRKDLFAEKLKEAKAFASRHNLLCNSKKYVGCDAPLIFICQKGHKWLLGIRALKSAIRQGRNCSHCRKADRREKRNDKGSKNTTTQRG